MSCPARQTEWTLILMSDDSICASPRGALFFYNVGNGIRVPVTSEAVFRNRFRRLRFLRFDAFGNLHCTKCYFWKDCCLPRITRRSKIACSSQFTLSYLEKNSHCTRFNRVSTFRFPIQRFSIPQQYFCSH